MIDKQFLVDGAIASSTTAAVSMADITPILPIIIGLLAPIIKEALFRFVDNVSKKNKVRNESKKNKK